MALSGDDKNPPLKKKPAGRKRKTAERVKKATPVPLTQYQKNWILDDSRFKIGLMSRQAGKSFATALEAVSGALRQKSKWVFLSAGERQSKELMLTAANHLRAYNKAIDVIEEGFKAEDSTEYKQLELVLPNGSRIIGLPANPYTARGHSAHILLDEFAFHKDSSAIWKALFPTVTRGYRIRIVSTPQGRQNMFYRLWANAESSGYSAHRVTIYDAVRMGLELKNDKGGIISPEELMLALNDDEAWAQEYMCDFVDESSALLSYEMIGECESDRCLWTEGYGYTEAPAGEYFIGMDIGRRNDLSVISTIENTGSGFITREVLVMKNTPFRDQQEHLHARIAALRPHRVCIDATGIGAMLAEEAARYFPCVEEISFTMAVKSEMASRTRAMFEDRNIRIPIDRDLREDLHSIRKTVTASGNVRYDAERTDSRGHADRFWSLALAIHAAGAQKADYNVLSGFRRTFSDTFKGY